MNFFDRLLLPENLNYAWIKAKRLYQTTDGYVDTAEIAEFELDLEKRLHKIRQRFKRGTWRTKKLKPLPRPKKMENDKPVDRQYYHVDIDDQVAWIAVVNALGPEIDQRMFSWSYGNRLYRPAWYEEENDRKSKLEIGPYRHASGHLYRKFQHSWPLFRRHVALTARAMARDLPENLDELEESDRLAVIVGEQEGQCYLQSSFWERKHDGQGKGKLHHATLDLEKFFPSIEKEAILEGLQSYITEDERSSDILSGMLSFRVDTSDMPKDSLERVEPSIKKGLIKGLPTGLFVAGFLANVALLKVDKLVNREVKKKVEHRSLSLRR